MSTFPASKRVGTRPAATRNTTPSSFTHPESLVLPDGPVPEETTELLHEFIRPHTRDETLVDADPNGQGSGGVKGKVDPRPWYKRPSPWWLLFVVPISAAVGSATLAPRIEVYTILACSVHKPDIFKQNYPDRQVDLPMIPPRIPYHAPYLPEVQTHSRGAIPFLTSSGGISQPGFWILDEDHKAGNRTDASTLDDRRQLCAKDPVVQAAVAKLTAVFATILGVLSCITTGWWGAYSDRSGRTVVMALSIAGLLVNDAVFILVALYTNYMPGGYWFLLFGAVAEGLCGGIATGAASVHSYMADTSDEGNWSRILSLSLGLLYTGMAFGPTLGSLLIRATGTTLSVFYVATAAHGFYCLLAWLVLPESLDPAQRDKSRAKYANESLVAAEERARNPAIGIFVRLKTIFSFLSPLAVFAPVTVQRRGNPLKRPQRDWSLALLATGYGITISLMGSYSYKFQYAAATYGWTAEILGYWLSLIGAARAVFLTVVLPLALKLFKPKPVIIEIPAPNSSQSNPDTAPSGSSATNSPPPNTIKKEIHSPAFDLNLARTSIIMECIVYTGMALAPSALAFTVFGMMGALGTAFNPAVQSVSLALYARRGGTETGRLFGGLSVIQALAASIIGPSIYGFVYVRTVSTMPRMIFYVSVATLLVSCLILTFVRIPEEATIPQQQQHQGTRDDEEEAGSGRVGDTMGLGLEREETLVQQEFSDGGSETRRRVVASGKTTSTYGAV